MARAYPHSTPNDGLASAPDIVFRIWRNRQRIEHEAASIFASLSNDLSVIRGKKDAITIMAQKASEDELRHAEYCQQIVVHSSKPMDSIGESPKIMLGPGINNLQKRVIYTCVAASCITETLSTALLVDMHKKAAPGMLREIIHHILIDEIDHSRIGWAELARSSHSHDLSWLSPHIPQMIRDAFVSDINPMLNQDENQVDLSNWGILSPARSTYLMTQTIKQIILPGLAQYGIQITQSELSFAN